MFNPNQKVVCIDDSGNRPTIKNGRVYTVAHQFLPNELLDHQNRMGGGVMLLDHKNRDGALVRPPIFYAERRFRLATDAEISAGGGEVSRAPEVTRVEVGEAFAQAGNVSDTARAPAPAPVGSPSITEFIALTRRVSTLEDGLSDHRQDDDRHCN